MEPGRFRRRPLMGILRGGTLGQIEPLASALVSAGIETFEVTLNTPGALQMIARLRSLTGSRLMIGAGTVLRSDQVKEALDAGATFIVSPTFVPAVVDACSERGVPVFPGAWTPTEVYAAWQARPTMVKLFPAQALGPSYVRELRGPFPDIDLLVCGGVRPSNLADYFEAGAAGAAFGGSVFHPDRLAAGDFAAIETDLRDLVHAYDDWLSRSSGS